MFATLRERDGFGQTTPELMPMVERLQRALARAGHAISPDGLFGQGTRQAVEAFQRSQSLTVDGIAGPATWRALEPFLRPSERGLAVEGVPGFETFRGDLAWVHAREGHVGKPYWPGGQSGVTLDPGFDLGFQTMKRSQTLYGSILSSEQERALSDVIGRRSESARDALRTSPVLSTIRVSRQNALRIMPHVAVTYWSKISTRFPEIAEPESPPSAHTVMLSLAYNRGAGNRHLEPLRAPISNRDWLSLAELVGSMQQDHELPGIRRRRRMEADLIRDELTFG